MLLNGTIDTINARAAACMLEPPMTVSKDLDLYDLMCWFLCGCLAIVMVVVLGHFLLWSFLRFQRLLELPCG